MHVEMVLALHPERVTGSDTATSRVHYDRDSPPTEESGTGLEQTVDDHSQFLPHPARSSPVRNISSDCIDPRQGYRHAVRPNHPERRLTVFLRIGECSPRHLPADIDSHRKRSHDRCLEKDASRPRERVQKGLSLLHSRHIHESPGELREDSGGVEECARPWPAPRPPLVHESRLREQEIGPPLPPPLD